jgi:hypothetical protein
MSRESRIAARAQVRADAVDQSLRREITDLRATISTRLAALPRSWVEKYNLKLVENGINVSADINRIHNVDNLRTRARLLPPPVKYVHMRSAAYPSIPEHRATSCRRMTRHTRDYVKTHCSNATITSATTGNPISVKRFAPHNIQAYSVNGRHECLSKALLKMFHKHGYTVAQSYQRDAHGDEWPELIGASTSGGNFRIPYHVAEECDTSLRVPPPDNRRQPPHESRYA